MNKWFMHNLEFVPGSETHKIIWGFEIQTNHQISARQPDLEIVKNNNNNNNNNKRTNRIVDFVPQGTTEGRRKEK